VLVAEDEFLVAVLLADDLRLAGCSVLGPYPDLTRATLASRTERFDLAILDINLNGEMAFPLADELLVRKVPFLFLSGYGASDLPAQYRSLPRLAKPHEPRMLVRELQRIALGAR
jgi:DNA-binding response OmpR family regulator